MKTWLSGFRTSLALDAGNRRRGKSWGRRSDATEINRGDEALHSVDRQLKVTQPTPPVPAGLHASVMRAVRAAARPMERQSVRGGLRWLPAPALAALVMCSLWWSFPQPRHEPISLTAASTMLTQRNELAQKTRDVVLAPLSQEMENLNRDFKNAVDFLVASVP